jgi:reactive intermediate/imine deaminase
VWLHLYFTTKALWLAKGSHFPSPCASETYYSSQGQLGVDNNNQLVPGGIQAEAHQTLNNIGGALKRRGLGFEDVVKCTVFLADVSEWGTFNAIYGDYFEKPYPARSALGANGLALGARLELECIAAYPDIEAGD